MCNFLPRVGLAFVIFLIGTTACSDEPAPKPRPVPEKEAAPPRMEIVYPVYGRVNRYQVWEYYGVDRRGGFRPRVIYSPYQPYYLYNGQAYPWAMTHPLDVMPHVVD